MINVKLEVERLQNRFGEYYAGRTVFDVRTRQRLMFGIIALGMAAKAIRRERNIFRRSQLLSEFVSKRDILRGVFFCLEGNPPQQIENMAV